MIRYKLEGTHFSTKKKLVVFEAILPLKNTFQLWLALIPSFTLGTI